MPRPPLALPPEPTPDSACMHCNTRPPVEGHVFCAECLQDYAALTEHNQALLAHNQALRAHNDQLLQDQLALGAEFLPRLAASTEHIAASTEHIQASTNKFQEWLARINHNETRRAGQRDILVAWQAQRDSAPLPEPAHNAPKELWFAYVSDQRQRGTHASWAAIAKRTCYAASTLRTGYSTWQKAHKTTKNNISEDD